ncbi:beta-galactosidase-like isoform X2 [Rhodnius prolixus]|uniref:beta-galactosidase-like isoform X2 n=1 Tax=Rhodnius prolixus TaxID=13249 RepID=UPI003D18FA78
MTEKREFIIDYDTNEFMMDGEPFTYASGELHYFRVPQPYWRDRMRKYRYAGLNAISTYIEWSLHEPSPNRFVFDGEANITEFIKIAQEEDLYVIVRPGPYICAERDFGGYPAWLLSINPKMKLRTSDPSHTFFIARWFRHLMGQLQPKLYGNGGPIIMVQVENEYGSYPVNDPNYLLWLRDLYRNYIGNAAILFTTDGPSRNFVRRGKIPGVLSTIDFGPTTTDLDRMYRPLRQVQPKGPLINSEFYVGWLSYWSEPFSRTEIKPILETIDKMLNKNVSFNMYMFHGGTNFGFTAGSGSSDHFQPDITSYDYDAPITEAGDLTEKFFEIKNAIKEVYPSGGTSVKRFTEKGDYGSVSMKPVISLLQSPIGSEPVMTEYPITFEALGQRYGFVAYSTQIINPGRDPSVLQVNIRDRALVLLNEEEVSVLQYTLINETPLPSTLEPGQTLTLLIENQGRRNFQLLSDCTKGLISNATIDGVTLKDWKVIGYPLNSEDIIRIEELANGDENQTQVVSNIKLPAFYYGEFQIPQGKKALDTFLDMTHWGKGVVFINNYNMGRYWHVGPQFTLYVPGCYLKEFPENNTITLLELHYTHPDKTVTFVTEPKLDIEKKADEENEFVSVTKLTRR